MKQKLWILILPLVFVGTLTSAMGDTALDRYFALRRQTRADQITPAQVLADPEGSIGKTIEIRGTVSGTARSAGNTILIVDTQSSGSFVVNTPEEQNIASGSSVCMLVKVGEKCKLSLTDLQLVAVAYQSAVVGRERAAFETEESARRAKEAARARRMAIYSRSKRVENPMTSRSAAPVDAEAMVAAYRKAIRGFNPRLSETDADTIARSIIAFSMKYRVDARLVVAVILTESHFRPEATSKRGAMGLGQLMPGTAAGLGVSNAYDPVSNIAGSVRMIKGHLERLSGKSDWNDLTWHDLSLALASYNAGPGAVRKYGGVPPYRETRNYVNRVCSIYKQLCGGE